MLLALLAGCADLLIDSIKGSYTPDPPRVATGVVWPPVEDDGAAESRAVGGTATTRVAHDGLYWTYDVEWRFVFFDESGAPIAGVEDQIQLGWSEWASPDGEVYRLTEAFACEPAAAADGVEGARLGILLDHTASGGAVDSAGARREGAKRLYAAQADRFDGFGLGVYADGSACFDDVDVFERGGGAFPGDAEGWSTTLDGLSGCEAGARHYLLDGLDALTAAIEADGGTADDSVLVVYAAAADAGSAAEAGLLAASAPPVFEVRAAADSDVVDEVLITQSSGGALVFTPEDGTSAAFAAVGTLLDGGAAGYRCTARMEVEMADETRTPSWLEAFTYLPPTSTRVQVSVPWILGFSTL